MFKCGARCAAMREGRQPHSSPPVVGGEWIARRAPGLANGRGGEGASAVSARTMRSVRDGNIHSLGGDCGYDGAVNRTVVVATSAATEALTKVYGQTALVKELTGR